MGNHSRGRRSERDMLGQREGSQIDRGYRLALLVGHESIARETRASLGAAARHHGQAGGEKGASVHHKEVIVMQGETSSQPWHSLPLIC